VSRTVRTGILLLIALVLGGLKTASAAPSWSNNVSTLPCCTGAPERESGTGAYDAATNQLIVFGGGRFGSSSSAPGVFFNDVGAVTNANGVSGAIGYQTLIAQGTAGSPAPRGNHTAVYDSANSRMIVFGGCNAVTFMRDTGA
jgi:hypothetical protein